MRCLSICTRAPSSGNTASFPPVPAPSQTSHLKSRVPQNPLTLVAHRLLPSHLAFARYPSPSHIAVAHRTCLRLRLFFVTIVRRRPRSLFARCLHEVLAKLCFVSPLYLVVTRYLGPFSSSVVPVVDLALPSASDQAVVRSTHHHITRDLLGCACCILIACMVVKLGKYDSFILVRDQNF